MKTRQNIFILAVLAVVCLAVSGVPVVTQAQEFVDCQAIVNNPALGEGDFDGDGLSDFLECTFIPYLNNTMIASCVDSTIPSQDPAAREQCFNSQIRNITVDPMTKDIFVILFPNTSGTYTDPDGNVHTSFIVDQDGNYRFDPLEFVKKPMEDGGLGLTVHSITPDQSNIDRQFTMDPGCKTKAVRMFESLEYSTVNGITHVGTPMDYDDTTVFTRAIVDLVEEELNGQQIDPTPVWTEYIKHTFAHEMGHTLTEYEPVSRKDGPHLPGGSEWVMERFVAYKYSKKDEYTTFYTGTVFEPSTQAGIEFYEQ